MVFFRLSPLTSTGSRAADLVTINSSKAAELLEVLTEYENSELEDCLATYVESLEKLLLNCIELFKLSVIRELAFQMDLEFLKSAQELSTHIKTGIYFEELCARMDDSSEVAEDRPETKTPLPAAERPEVPKTEEGQPYCEGCVDSDKQEAAHRFAGGCLEFD